MLSLLFKADVELGRDDTLRARSCRGYLRLLLLWFFRFSIPPTFAFAHLTKSSPLWHARRTRVVALSVFSDPEEAAITLANALVNFSSLVLRALFRSRSHKPWQINNPYLWKR